MAGSGPQAIAYGGRPPRQGSVGFDELKIRDVSRFAGEWAPPIGVLGGPPAHELYRDLVLYAGFQLFRDSRSRPWVVLRDGAHRRAFSVPSAELRGALDRFRMRRNTRPLPETDLEEFFRVVDARVSDPDVHIPLLRSPVADGHPAPAEATVRSPPSNGHEVPWTDALEGGAAAPPPNGHGTDGATSPAPATAAGSPEVPAEAAAPAEPVLTAAVDPATSGGYRLPSSQSVGVARYVRILRRLLREGDWMGTTRELSELTSDDPLTLYNSLLRYRSELADNDILLANVDVGDGTRWLAVDRAKFRTALEGRPSDARALPAE